jgi:hypothetical protein
MHEQYMVVRHVWNSAQLLCKFVTRLGVARVHKDSHRRTTAIDLWRWLGRRCGCVAMVTAVALTVAPLPSTFGVGSDGAAAVAWLDVAMVTAVALTVAPMPSAFGVGSDGAAAVAWLDVAMVTTVAPPLWLKVFCLRLVKVVLFQKSITGPFLFSLAVKRNFFDFLASQ